MLYVQQPQLSHFPRHHFRRNIARPYTPHALCNEWYTHDIAHYASDRCNSLLRSLAATYIFTETYVVWVLPRTATSQPGFFVFPAAARIRSQVYERIEHAKQSRKLEEVRFGFQAFGPKTRKAGEFAWARMTSRIGWCKQVCICNRAVCRGGYIYTRVTYVSIIYTDLYIYTHIYVHTYSYIYIYNVKKHGISLYIIMVGTHASPVDVCT